MPSAKLAFLGCFIAMLIGVARAADVYSVGQKVEIREGDAWSAANIIAHEGRKYQVHYEGSDATNDEWVTADRIRTVSASGNSVPGPAATTPPTAKFNVGDQIEAKWGGVWRKAAVTKKTGDWTLVKYDDVWLEWVQPWRLREIGSTKDTESDSTPRGFVEASTPAPTQSPQELSPDASTAGSDAFHISEKSGPRGIAITAVDRSGSYLTLSGAVKAPVPDASITAPKPNLLSLQPVKAVSGSTMDLLVSPNAAFAVALGLPSNFREPSSIQRIDLAQGKAGDVLTLAAELQPLALNDSGTRLITRSDKFFPATKWRLDLWAYDGASLKPLLSFRPYDQGTDGSDGVRWAEYVDASRLLTCSNGNIVSLWQLTDTSVKRIYAVKCDDMVKPRLSQGGKYFIAGRGRQAVVCDALTGQCCAKCGSVTDLKQMAASVDQRVAKLALCGGSRLVVCDLRKDEVLIDTGLPVGITGSSADWISDNLLLIDREWIFDIDHHAMVWQFTSPPAPAVSCWIRNSLWLMLGGDDPVLTAANVLIPQVLDADRNLGDAIYVVAPGTKVSLQINVSCGDDDKARIIQALTLRAKMAGWVIADGQPILLTANSKDVDSRKITYQGRGLDRGTSETVNVSNTVESLSLVIDSKPVWSVNSQVYNGAPPLVIHRAGESVAQHLDQQKKSNLDWFGNVALPKTVARLAEPVGSSALAP